MKDVEILGDGEIVWINGGPTGGAIGRFGKQGIDVHSLDTTSCLYCTHSPTSIQDWFIFQEKMLEHHGVSVPDHLIPRRFYKDLIPGRTRYGSMILISFRIDPYNDDRLLTMTWLSYADFVGRFRSVEFPRTIILWHELEMIMGHGTW